MKEKVKNDDDSNFTRYSTQELFEYMLDNLLIAPDEEYETWRHYRAEMLEIATSFYKEHNNFVEL